jgi:ABC-type microcin C transport system duplicated ATPase subunit YejF
MAMNNGERVLEVKDLRTYFYTKEGVVKAVDGLSYYVKKGECGLGLSRVGRFCSKGRICFSPVRSGCEIYEVIR